MLEAYENRLPGEKLSLLVSLPFISVHVGALFALTISPSPFALFMVFLMYFIRMFGITAGFHRFFSHKTFKTSRAFQFILAYLATSSAQMGTLTEWFPCAGNTNRMPSSLSMPQTFCRFKDPI